MSQTEKDRPWLIRTYAGDTLDWEAKLVLRAEKLLLLAEDAEAPGMVTAPAVVETVDYQGQTVRYFIRAGDRQLQAINMIDGHPFAKGTQVTAAFRPRDCAGLPGA